MGLLWLFFCITEDSAEAKGAFSLRALTRLTRVTRDARTENAPIYQLRQLWSIRPALSADNVKMLVHAFVASRVDYCNSILYQVAAVHLRPLQSAARLVVKKRKCDSITPTLLDDLHWLLVRQRVDFKICLGLLVCLHQLAPVYLTPLLTPVTTIATRRHLRSANAGDLATPRTRTVGFGP